MKTDVTNSVTLTLTSNGAIGSWRSLAVRNWTHHHTLSCRRRIYVTSASTHKAGVYSKVQLIRYIFHRRTKECSFQPPRLITINPKRRSVTNVPLFFNPLFEKEKQCPHSVINRKHHPCAKSCEHISGSLSHFPYDPYNGGQLSLMWYKRVCLFVPVFQPQEVTICLGKYSPFSMELQTLLSRRKSSFLVPIFRD